MNKLIIKFLSAVILSIVFLSITTTVFASKKITSKNEVALIVLGEYVVTMNDDQMVIKDGAVAVKGNKIVAVGSRKDIEKKYQSKKVIKGESKILMPGLINGHTHTAMTLFRGMADDLELMTWLSNYIFPTEAQFVDPEFIKIGTRLACWEMIRGGTTSFVDMYFYPEVISEETIKCGLRGVIGSPSIDFPSPGFEGWGDSFKHAVNYVENWQGKHERITPAFAPHAPYTVSPAHLKQVADKARELNAPITIHLAESLTESETIKKQYNSTPVQHVYDQGMMDGIQLIAAHMVHPTSDEIKLISGKTVGAIHNPTSNLKLASGISPVAEMLKSGALVGIGTDGAASNNDLDLWEEMRLAALLHKVRENDSTVLPALTALKMATSMGAEAVGLGDVTGQLKLGMRADMIQISIDDLRLLPLYDVISHLVYVVDSNDVTTTIVSGDVLMEDKKILTIDEIELKKLVKAKADEMSRALRE